MAITKSIFNINDLPQKHWILSILFLLSMQTINAQILPGDSDNNGKVENVDLLYTGFAYGNTGPARIGSPDFHKEQAIQSFWDAIFPSGLDLAFADANGDGIINYLDFITTLQNYGTTQAGYTPPIYFQDASGIPLKLQNETIPQWVVIGTRLEVPIYFGKEDHTAASFQGLAFTIEYDSNVVKDFTLDFSDSWLGNPTNLFNVNKKTEDGVTEVALTKFGNAPSYGNGIIGYASFIIEEDLADWFATPQDSIETTIKITKIVYKAANFESMPTQTEELNIMLHHPDALLAIAPTPLQKSIIIAPNPTNNSTTIIAPSDIKTIEIYDIGGRKVFSRDYHQKEIKLDRLEQFGSGIFFIKINTANNQITKKILIQN